ncbi:MAG: hypothetical protein CM1200mP24_08840 [Gammaproteobacteria bacterium]|nr:MAG: hypothetical protein CM1200mP24_08840 [Gammaproteobacteria bacterium]
MILVPAEKAKDFPHKPTYILSAVSGSHYRAGASVHNTPDYGPLLLKPLHHGYTTWRVVVLTMST